MKIRCKKTRRFLLEIEIEEYDYAKETIAEVKYLLNHIKDKPKLKINNIF